MKKILLSTIAIGTLFAAQPTNEELVKQLNSLQQQIQKLQQEIQKNKKDIKVTKKKVNPIASNNHLFWNFDLRTSYDVISKETTSGNTYKIAPDMSGQSGHQFAGKMTGRTNGKTHTGQVFSNRVILTGVYKASDQLKATVRVEANKMFGMNSINGMNQPFQNNDWVGNETPDDTTIRLKEAFFNYHFGPDGGFMFSAGRRPATEGFPANLREGDNASSPLGHLINMEFDGFSFEIGNPIFSKLSDTFTDWGTWMKFCLGRGYTDSTGKWSMSNSSPDYTKTGAQHSDFGGFLLVPYDDGQYALKTETVWASNLKGFKISGDNKGNLYGDMKTLGDYFGENILLSANGIGDGISDFLDDTTAFASFALSQTKPKSGERMLGSTNNKTGHSIWIGADMPGVGDNDRFGVSFVKGSKYYRSFTYGEDTLAGSMAAIRGKAYDIYYTHEIIPHLTAQLRYTYLDYDYAGSDAFFGDMGNPDNPYNLSYVKTAKDLRVYIRYNF